jgi:hypothetical protein
VSYPHPHPHVHPPRRHPGRRAVLSASTAAAALVVAGLTTGGTAEAANARPVEAATPATAAGRPRPGCRQRPHGQRQPGTAASTLSGSTESDARLTTPVCPRSSHPTESRNGVQVFVASCHR